MSSRKPRTSSPTNGTATCPIATPSPTWGVSCLVSKTSLPQLELPVAPKPWTGNRGRHLKALTASLLQQLLGLRRAVASRPRHRLPRLSVLLLLKPLESPSLNPSTPPRPPPPPPPSWARTPSGSGSVQPTTTENHHLSLPCSPRLQLHGTESVACLLLLLLLSASVIIITPLRLALRLHPADLQDLLPCIRASTYRNPQQSPGFNQAPPFVVQHRRDLAFNPASYLSLSDAPVSSTDAQVNRTNSPLPPVQPGRGSVFRIDEPYLTS